MSGIGVLNEKPLHASLKEWYAQPGDHFEVAVDGFVIDIVRGDLLLEIQTGNFSSMKSKLNKLVHTHQIRVIYPIAQEKWIVKPSGAEGDGMTRRKSPKRGQLVDLFWELVSFPQLLMHDNFTLEVLLIQQEELRRYDEKLNWRRRGWGIVERRLLEVVDRKVFETQADWHELLPEGLGEEFVAKELASASGIGIQLAQKMAYCLRHMNVIELVGKKNRANLYKVVTA